MSSEKDESYWIGVRDALRMIDSFLRWSRRNPTIAKSLDEFLAEGLVAAAKRCESCLGRELGLKYGKEDPEKGMDESLFDETPSDTTTHEHREEVPSSPDSTPTDALGDSLLEDMPMSPLTEIGVPDFEAEVPLPDDVSIDEEGLVDAISDAISDKPIEYTSPAPALENDELQKRSFIESIEPQDGVSSVEELEYNDESAEFSSDFELGEPEPLVIESEDADDVTPKEVSSIVFEDSESESAPSFDFDAPEQPESFEQPVSSETIPTQPENLVIEEPEVSSDNLESSSGSPSDEDSESAVSSLAEIWSPYDEPSVPDDELAIDDDESTPIILSDESNIDEGPPPRKVPPPPPPPETDESEEERRKRARRLFFGA